MWRARWRFPATSRTRAMRSCWTCADTAACCSRVRWIPRPANRAHRNGSGSTRGGGRSRHTLAALRALAANKLRSVLTMLGIIIGVGAVITMIAVGRGATERVQEQMKGLGSNIMLVLPGGVTAGGVRLGAQTGQGLTEEDAVAIAREALRAGTPWPSSATLQRRWNAVKVAEFPYVSEVTKLGPEQAFRALDKARNAWREKRSRIPRFHKKGVNESCCVGRDKNPTPFFDKGVLLYPNKGVARARVVRIPGVGFVKCHRRERWPDAEFVQSRVKLVAGRWWLTVTYRLPDDGDTRERAVCNVCQTIHYENPLNVVGTAEQLSDAAVQRQWLPLLQAAAHELRPLL